MRTSNNWIERARLMEVGDILHIGAVTHQSVRQSLERLKRDPDPKVRAKRYRVRAVPDPHDRKTLVAIKAGELPPDAFLVEPRGTLYLCCGKKWPDLRGFPRAKRAKPDPQAKVSNQVSGYRVPQSFPDYDAQSQIPPDWDT